MKPYGFNTVSTRSQRQTLFKKEIDSVCNLTTYFR